jgi:hypothetical protein
MTTTNFDPPPEARLIEQLRADYRPALSIAEAARRSDMSEARWRQIAKGVQQINAETRVPVIAPATTLARMGRAVGATPMQLVGVGRPDAAEVLETMALHPSDPQMQAAVRDAAREPAEGGSDRTEIERLENLWRDVTAVCDGLHKEKHRLADLSDKSVLSAFDVIVSRLLELGAGDESRPLVDELYSRAAQSRASLRR